MRNAIRIETAMTRRLIGWRVRYEMHWLLAWESAENWLTSLPKACDEARGLRKTPGYRNVRVMRVFRVRRGK